MTDAVRTCGRVGAVLPLPVPLASNAHSNAG